MTYLGVETVTIYEGDDERQQQPDPEPIDVTPPGMAPDNQAPQRPAAPADDYEVHPGERAITKDASKEGALPSPVTTVRLRTPADAEEFSAPAPSRTARALGATTVTPPETEEVPAQADATAAETVSAANGTDEGPRDDASEKSDTTPAPPPETPPPAEAGDGRGDGGVDRTQESGEDDDNPREVLPGKEQVLAMLQGIGEPDGPIIESPSSVYEDPALPEYDRVAMASNEVCLRWRGQSEENEAPETAVEAGEMVLREALVKVHEDNGFQVEEYEETIRRSQRQYPTVRQVSEAVQEIYARSETPPSTELRSVESPEVVEQLQAVRAAAVRAGIAERTYYGNNSHENFIEYYADALPVFNQAVADLDVTTLDLTRGELPDDMKVPLMLAHGSSQAARALEGNDKRVALWADREQAAWNDFRKKATLEARRDAILQEPFSGTETLSQHETNVIGVLCPPFAPPAARAMFEKAVRQAFADAGHEQRQQPVDPQLGMPSFATVASVYRGLLEEQLKSENLLPSRRKDLMRQFTEVIEQAGRDL